jgi:hypothetical protein
MDQEDRFSMIFSLSVRAGFAKSAAWNLRWSSCQAKLCLPLAFQVPLRSHVSSCGLVQLCVLTQNGQLIIGIHRENCDT